MNKMDIENVYDNFIKTYKIILEKQWKTISDPKYFIFFSNIVFEFKEKDKSKLTLDIVNKKINILKNEVDKMSDIFIKDGIYVNDILLFFFNSEKKVNLLNDLNNLEMVNPYFYIFKNENNIFEIFFNEYMNILVNILESISKLFYKFLQFDNLNYNIIIDHIDFIEVLKDLILYILTNVPSSMDKKFENIMITKNILEISEYIKNKYILISEDLLNLSIYDILSVIVKIDKSFDNSLPFLYQSFNVKISYLFEDMIEYINNILNIIKDKNLSEKYLHFYNILGISSDEYDKINKDDILIKSNYSNYIKTNVKLMFNLSFINLPNDITMITYRTTNEFSNNIIPKNIQNCYNIFDNEKRLNKNDFMWNVWGIPISLFDNFGKLAFVKTSDFYSGIFDIDESIKLNNYDHRLQKIYINIENIQFYKNTFDNVSPFNENNNYYYIILYDTTIKEFIIYGLKNNKIFKKTIEMPQDCNVYNHIIKGKNKNYAYIDHYIDNDNNIIMIFSEWFYQDGLKFLYINLNNFYLDVDIRIVYNDIKIYGIPKNIENSPYFSFSTNTVNVGPIYIGVGHTKIKNGNYKNKQCIYPRTITDLLNYSVFGKDYIRHFGSTNVNQLFYNDGNYIPSTSKDVENVDEDYSVIEQDTECIGYQYYMFFYIFEFLENFSKLKYFKISDSFIPIINENKIYENYNYSLVFPMTILLENDKIMISSGEGDCRSFIINYDLEDVLKICIHDIKYIDTNMYKFYTCT